MRIGSWIACVVCTAFIAFAGCSDGGSGGGDDNGSNSGSGDSGDSGYYEPDYSSDPDTPDNPDNPDTPIPEPTPAQKEISDLLKEYMKNNYDNLSGEVASNNINLTAQTIKEVGDIFPVLEDAANNSESMSRSIASEKIKDEDSELNRAIIAQEKGYIKVVLSGNKYTISYNKGTTFNGTFNLSEIEIGNNNGNGNFENATLTNNTADITIERINSIRGNYQPTLNLKVSGGEAKNIYNLYQTYYQENQLNKLTLSGDLGDVKMDGKAIKGNPSDYTLFNTAGDAAKGSNDPSITSMDANLLVKMTQQLGIYKLSNMIISGSADTATVLWGLRNMVFEGDMSKVENTTINSIPGLIGVVYFKDKPYNNVKNMSERDNAFGLVKLDKLEDVDGSYFKVGINANGGSVLDFRNVDKDFIINTYNPSSKIVRDIGNWNAIYFPNIDDVDEAKNKKFYEKIVDTSAGEVSNVYYGDKKMYGHYSDSRLFKGGSKTPRTLKAFEEYGNSYVDNSDDITSVFNNNYYMKFTTSARSTYSDAEFNSLTQESEKESLQEDHEEGYNMLAQNRTSRCFS